MFTCWQEWYSGKDEVDEWDERGYDCRGDHERKLGLLYQLALDKSAENSPIWTGQKLAYMETVIDMLVNMILQKKISSNWLYFINELRSIAIRWNLRKW